MELVDFLVRYHVLGTLERGSFIKVSCRSWYRFPVLVRFVDAEGLELGIKGLVHGLGVRVWVIIHVPGA